MDFYNLFKAFLGVPNRNNTPDVNPNDNDRQYWNEPNSHPGYDPNNGPYENDSEDDQMFFNIFSNPLEMHRYFEHQMNDILKSFSMFGMNDNVFDNPHDSIEGAQPLEPHRETNLRDHYLKPGYERAVIDESTKKDVDLDGKINTSDLDQILTTEPSTSQLIPRKEQPRPSIQFFGQTFSSRIIHRPDGSQEIHKTLVDQDGNETKTITKQQGDQKYTITTKTDKYGKKEVTEDLFNTSENDIGKYKGKPEGPFYNEKVPHNWFPFDKFFK